MKDAASGAHYVIMRLWFATEYCGGEPIVSVPIRAAPDSPSRLSLLIGTDYDGVQELQKRSVRLTKPLKGIARVSEEVDRALNLISPQVQRPEQLE